MDLHAATANPTTGKAILLVAGLVWLVGYAVACWWWPFKACRRCEGVGKFRSPSGKAWRRCKTCSGTGGRVRTGRRFLNWTRTTKRRAS